MVRELFILNIEGTQEALRRFLVALCCGDSQLADDIAQETLMKAYLSCDDIKDARKFKAWIFRIAYNTFLDQRRRMREYVSCDRAADLHSADGADASFRYQDLYAALDLLSEKERTSVLLFYMEDYSIKEIAKMLDTSQGAVKQHLSRGREHLRRILGSKTLK